MKITWVIVGLAVLIMVILSIQDSTLSNLIIQLIIAILPVVILFYVVRLIVRLFRRDGESGKRKLLGETSTDTGIRDLLNEGQKDEAIELYARFAGVDLYTAQDAVEKIEREIRLSKRQ